MQQITSSSFPQAIPIQNLVENAVSIESYTEPDRLVYIFLQFIRSQNTESVIERGFIPILENHNNIHISASIIGEQEIKENLNCIELVDSDLFDHFSYQESHSFNQLFNIFLTEADNFFEEISNTQVELNKIQIVPAIVLSCSLSKLEDCITRIFHLTLSSRFNLVHLSRSNLIRSAKINLTHSSRAI